MNLIRIGLASIDTIVGGKKSNFDRIISAARQMAEQGCAIGAFQEQVLYGYPAEDLIQWPSFVDGQWQSLLRFAGLTAELSTPTVFCIGLTVRHANGELYNVNAVVCNGKILGLVPKEKLPTYNVFYEARTFSSGTPYLLDAINGVPFGDLIFRFPHFVLGVEVCEDIWSSDGPMKRRAYDGAEIIVNASASPWRAGITGTRREMIPTRAADNQCIIVYANMYGGNDSLVFDGGGCINQNGRMVLETPRWQEGVWTQVVDLDRTRRQRAENTTWRSDRRTYLTEGRHVHLITSDEAVTPDNNLPYPYPVNRSFFLPAKETRQSAYEEFLEDLLQAMKVGLSGYFEKSGVFQRIGIALSGGKDSALCAIVAWLYAQERFAHLTEAEEKRQAVADFLSFFSMPTRFNSDTTKSIAQQLSAELGASFFEYSIEGALDIELAATQAMLGGQEPNRSTKQNIQARLRGSRMWNWSNTANGMWIQTGNMTEKALGYTTVGGDQMGAFSLIGNMPKTVIIALLRYVAVKYQLKSVARLLETKASAELEADQEDERDLAPFAILDTLYALFVGEKYSPAEVYTVVRQMWTDEELTAIFPGYTRGLLKQWVKKFIRLFRASIFKWVFSPETVHLGSLDLDRERALQLPVIQSAEWLNPEELDSLPD
ncbi:MAG: NAD(+) synthase [Candidatus Komeilibacteria bacterium]